MTQLHSRRRHHHDVDIYIEGRLGSCGIVTTINWISDTPWTQYKRYKLYVYASGFMHISPNITHISYEETGAVISWNYTTLMQRIHTCVIKHFNYLEK